MPCPVDDIRISRADTPSTDDKISRNESRPGTPDTQNPTVTQSRRPGAAQAGDYAVFELEKVQRNFQVMMEKKIHNRLEIQRDRERRKLQEAETARMEQEYSNTPGDAE